MDYEGIIGDCLGVRVDKRDEIREGISQILIELRNNAIVLHKIDVQSYLKQIQEFEDSMGVVIKKEGELPEYVGCTCASDDYTKSVAVETQLDMLKAGYGTFERLIKETDDITKPG